MNLDHFPSANGTSIFLGILFSKLTINIFSDPFAVQEDGKDNSKIHVRVQQRNGRKCITTIQGLADDLDSKMITRALKKTFQCNGTVNNDLELGEIVQLSGDQRTNVRDFFIDQEICHEDQIVIHGG
jgi:translation initiation factor 1